MEVRQIPQPKTNYDPDSRAHKQEVKKIFDDYKDSKKNVIKPQDPEQALIKTEATIAVKDLPSKMLPYPQGSSVKFKPYTYGDLQFFNSSDLSEEDTIKFILDGIQTQGFDKSNLAYQDFLFIAILRKLSAWDSSKFTYKFVCEHCEELNNSKTGKLSDIEFKDLDIPSLPLIIDVDENTELLLNPLTVGAYLKLRSVKDDKFLHAYSECVVNMPSKRAFEIIKNAQGNLIEVLEEADTMLGFGEQSIECVCDHCKVKNSVPLTGVQDVLAPFRRERDVIRSSIRFK